MIQFAIVGCGHIAKKHAEAIQKIDGARLAAVCDTIPERMDEYVTQYDAIPYQDLSELLSREDIDVVNICTPSGHHASIAVQAAKAKKHVIVEKPIALTLEDADEIIRVCRENQVKLSVVHPNRFRPAVRALRQAFDEGRFGKLSHANATVRWNRNQAYYDQAPWRGTKALDGGVLMNQAIHNLDLLLWFMGEPAEVFAMSATRLRNIETEDVAVGTVRFQNGSLGVIEAATTIFPQNLEETFSIFGEHGTVKLGGRTANWIEHWNIASMDEGETRELIEKIHADPFGKPGHQCILEDMIEAIVNDREPAVSGEDGKNALRLVLSLYASAEQNMAVKWTDRRSLANS
ncbi:Gfo/Idh/MocA family oxidoreductase [Bacillaceae bacterium]